MSDCQIELDTGFKQGSGSLTVTGTRGTFNPANKLGSGTFRNGFRGKVGSQDVVVKTFKIHPHARASDWKPDVDESVKAAELAKEYSNKVFSLNKKFRFAIPKVFKVTRGCSNIWVNDRVLVEPMLPGKWLKWNNNDKYVNTEAPGVGHGSVVQAFSHWTYHRSGGTEILVDVQGTHGAKDEAYYFTDPAFNTKKGGTSSTDMGQKGINEFFQNYNKHWPCASNKFCKAGWMVAHRNGGGGGGKAFAGTESDAMFFKKKRDL